MPDDFEIEFDVTYGVNDDMSFTIYFLDQPIHTSRPFRLRCQAERQAQEWILQAIEDEPKGDITLDVQSVSIDPDTLFRRFNNG